MSPSGAAATHDTMPMAQSGCDDALVPRSLGEGGATSSAPGCSGNLGACFTISRNAVFCALIRACSSGDGPAGVWNQRGAVANRSKQLPYLMTCGRYHGCKIPGEYG